MVRAEQRLSAATCVTVTPFPCSQGTIRRGTRCSTAKAFLRPARLRANLHIAMHAHVTKVVINPATNQATGVQFVRDGRLQAVHAKREVILSAGSIGSPQLLMLSGVGPGEHLRRLGVPVLQDLRVGDNLQDHVGMFGLTFIVDKPVAIVQNRLRVRSSAFVPNDALHPDNESVLQGLPTFLVLEVSV